MKTVRKIAFFIFSLIIGIEMSIVYLITEFFHFIGIIISTKYDSFEKYRQLLFTFRLKVIYKLVDLFQFSLCILINVIFFLYQDPIKWDDDSLSGKIFDKIVDEPMRHMNNFFFKMNIPPPPKRSQQ